MGKYQTYPEYKSQHNEWLAELPTHWQLVALKRLLSTKVSDGPHETPQFQDDGVPFLSVDGIQDNRLVFEGCRFVSENDHQRYSLKCKPRFGDVLLGKAASVGKVAYVDTEREFNVWSPLAVIRPKSETTSGRFIFFAIQSKFLQAQCVVRSNSNTQNNLGMGDIENLKIPTPEPDEQHVIATFLDHETAKIDRLIARQERLIELLKEKRQAVISHAVTKGLNPDAPMKDTGVEWLGEVPAHWKMVKFSVAASIRNGQVDPRTVPYTDYTLIAPNHIESGTGRLLYTETAAEQGADSGKYLCKAGEVIYSKIRPTLAKACLSPSDRVLCSADMYPIQARGELTNKFLLRFMLTKEFTTFATLVSERVAMPKINREALAECRVPVPPADEQKKIIRFVETNIHTIDTLVEKAGEAIALMKEHRTALISAAVTGKVDVRGWQAPNTEPQETATAVSV